MKLISVVSKLARLRSPCLLLSTSSRKHVITRNISLFGIGSTNSENTKTDPSENVGESEERTSLIGRDFLSLKHFRADEIKQLLWTALDLKTRIKTNNELFEPLKGKTAAMISQSRSPGSRLATELGMARLGGQTAFLGPDQVQLGEKESIKDSARVLSGMADVIIVESCNQQVLNELANEASLPVVSGLTNQLHPLQILADLMTLQEYFGSLYGLNIAWVGDGSSVLHSLMYGCAKMGANLNVATPLGYEPDVDIMCETVKMANKRGCSLQLGNDAVKAVYRADAVLAGPWSSIEQKEEGGKRLRDFQGYQVNRKMMKEAGGDWVFMHCLPRRQEEVTDDIFYGKESLVWQESENRMWTLMAVLLHVLQPYTPTIPEPKFVRG